MGETGPREFFYGFTEMEKAGLSAELAEEEVDFPLPIPEGLVERLATCLLDPLAALNAATLSRLATPTALSRLNQAAAIVATTNAQGLALGALKSLGRISTPVLFLPMGVWPRDVSAWRRWLLRRWLGGLSLAPIGKPETEWLRKQASLDARLDYLPFGIDTDFWTPDPEPSSGDYVLSIGNDSHRDWECLAAAWNEGLPSLKLVTRREVPAFRCRIEHLVGDWNARPLSDKEIRSLYRKAKFVILPLRNTLQPSGQSSCLQAMACGKAVILSKIDGLWDDALLIDNETCLLIPPENAAALAEAAKRLADDTSFAEAMGQKARSLVMQHFSTEEMGKSLAARLRILMKEGA